MESIITEDTPFDPEDDTFHPPSDDPYWLENNWWSFNVPERRLGGWLHAGYHTNQGTVSSRVFVWDPVAPEPARLAYYRARTDVPMPGYPDLRDIKFPGGGTPSRC